MSWFDTKIHKAASRSTTWVQPTKYLKFKYSIFKFKHRFHRAFGCHREANKQPKDTRGFFESQRRDETDPLHSHHISFLIFYHGTSCRIGYIRLGKLARRKAIAAFIHFTTRTKQDLKSSSTCSLPIMPMTTYQLFLLLIHILIFSISLF